MSAPEEIIGFPDAGYAKPVHRDIAPIRPHGQALVSTSLEIVTGASCAGETAGGFGVDGLIALRDQSSIQFTAGAS